MENPRHPVSSRFFPLRKLVSSPKTGIQSPKGVFQEFFRARFSHEKKIKKKKILKL